MIEIKKLNNKNKKKFKALYYQSFPDSERKPYWLMKYWKWQGKMELYEVDCDDGFCGLFITVICDRLVLVDYLAVVPEMRGKGIGSEVIRLAKKMYEGKALFLEIESTMRDCPDMENRLKRKSFYLKNGLLPADFSVNLFGVEMEILYFSEKITFDEYMSLYKHMAGKLLKLKIDRLS